MQRTMRSIWSVITFPFDILAWIFRKIIAIPRAIGRSLRGVKEFFADEPEDTPLGDTFAKVAANPEDIFVHVDALRRHLLRSVIYLAITTVLSFAFAKQILAILSLPVGGLDAMVAIDVTEQVGVFMRVALLSGFAIALPFIAFELYLFIAPGISPKSRKFGLVAMPLLTVFFIAGMAFAYFWLLPPSLKILLNFMDIKTQVRPSSYIGFITTLLFWIGASFEFPFLIYVLAVIGLVKWKSLANQWRIAVVVIAVIAAAITPTVDPGTMALVMGPMIILYFISIGLAYLAQRGRQ